EVMRWMTERARRRPARVALPEGHNATVLRAAAQMVEERICRPVLLGRRERVEEKARLFGVDLTGVEIIHAASLDEDRHRYAEALFDRRARKGLTRAEARWNLYKPIYFAASMVAAGDADAVVAGV